MPAVATQAITDVTVGSSTWTLTAPASVAAGDMLVALFFTGSSLATPLSATRTGWSTADSGTSETGGADTACKALYRVADSTDAAAGSFAFTSLASAATGVGIVLRVTGAATTINAANHAAITSASTSHPTASITTTADGCLIVSAFGIASAAGVTWTPPGSSSEIVDHTGGPAGVLVSVEVNTETQTSAGAISLTATASSSDTGVNMILAIQAGAQTIAPSGLASAEAIGSHTVTPGAVTIAPSGIASAEAIGAHFVAVQFVAPTGIASGQALGSATVTATDPPDAPTGRPDSTVPAAPSEFASRWATGLHVGDTAPRMVVEVRKGRWRRGYFNVSDTVDATIDGEDASTPWLAYWDPAEDWLEVPGIADYTETQSFAENGCQVVTLTMGNVRMTAETGATSLPYRLLERGFASPTRSYDAPGRTADARSANEWYDRLAREAQIRVWHGYGDPERTTAVDGSTMPTDGGTNGMWVFAGQIDDIDLSDAPDHITISCRNGQPLTDQEFFGWSKSKQLKEPVVFADRIEAAGAPYSGHWILVDDVADVVRVVLRWAGYRDSAIETTGVRMKGHQLYNRQNKLIDPISAICEQTGYSFFMAPPLDGASLALPVFRLNGARDAAPAGMAEVAEDGLLTGAGYKQSTEPLAYIIRYRGKNVAATDPAATTLEGDASTRVMAEYRPPWSYQPGDPDLLEDRLAGKLKHVTETLEALRTPEECLLACKLLAFKEALEALQASIEVPGHPGLVLDGQVGVTDTTTAINSRLWIAERSVSFTTGEQTSWRVTLTGPLLDFPDVAAMLAELA